MTTQFIELEAINDQELRAAAGGSLRNWAKHHRTRQGDQPFAGDIPLQNLDQNVDDFKIMVA